MRKTKQQKEFEIWYGANMPPSRLPNLPGKPWTKRNSDGSYYWADLHHGFKCFTAGRNHEIQR